VIHHPLQPSVHRRLSTDVNYPTESSRTLTNTTFIKARLFSPVGCLV